MSAFGLPGVIGVIVLEMPVGSPFRQAGLRQNDVILAVNGEPVANTKSLPRLPDHSAISVRVFRNQREVTIRTGS
jgi:S1-C subfamily serine protease